MVATRRTRVITSIAQGDVAVIVPWVTIAVVIV
jgi:hypothetical protein